MSSCRYAACLAAARLARAHADNAARDLVAGDERVLGRSPAVLSLNRLPIGDISIADDQVRIFKIIADNLIVLAVHHQSFHVCNRVADQMIVAAAADRNICIGILPCVVTDDIGRGLDEDAFAVGLGALEQIVFHNRAEIQVVMLLGAKLYRFALVRFLDRIDTMLVR